jgi:hypothetical protein
MMYPNGKHRQDVPEEIPEGTEEVGAYLKRWAAPAPDPAAKARLLELLAAEMPVSVPLPERQVTRRSATWAWLILRSQVRLVHPATWAGSGLVIALGALVSLAFYAATPAGTHLPFVLVAPLVAACGVAFLYGGDADPAVEVQLATPVSARVILLARLALLFGFNLAITLACSVGLAVAQAEISLMPLVASWLAPMTLLSALAFLLSALFFDSLASVLISLLLWVGIALRHFVQIEAFVLPDILQPSFYPLMLVAAPVLVVAALWIAEREERWAGGAG